MLFDLGLKVTKFLLHFRIALVVGCDHILEPECQKRKGEVDTLRPLFGAGIDNGIVGIYQSIKAVDHIRQFIQNIVERNGIEREDVLNDILDFLASQISSLTNPTNIANAIASMKNEKINPAMVSNYVQYVIDSFLISMAKRYDVKGKTYFKYPNKYYYTDIGLRNARLNYRQYDPGHIMENIIYNELLQRGYSVDVGVVCDRTGDSKVQKEIDFVVNDADKKIYIQSAFRMDTDKKESSELASLMLTRDFFKKIIVRMDVPHNFYDDNGIFHCNLIDLLLGRVELF